MNEVVCCKCCSLAGFVFDDTNYDNTNTNSNVSSHLCNEVTSSIDLTNMVKKIEQNNRR